MSMACLSDPKVRRQIGDADDHTKDLMRDLQDDNDLAVFKLNQEGFIGITFSVKIEKVPKEPPITQKNSQERILALAKVKTHGAKFIATRGGHVTSNDMFKSMEMDVRENEIKDMEKDKEARKKLEKFEKRVSEALICVGCDYEQLKGTELVHRYPLVAPNSFK